MRIGGRCLMTDQIPPAPPPQTPPPVAGTVGSAGAGLAGNGGIGAAAMAASVGRAKEVGTAGAVGAKKAVLSPKEAFKQALSQGSDKESGSAAKENGDIGPSSNVIDFVDNIIENGITLGVSDIHMEPFEARSRLRYRRDGTLKEVEEFATFLHANYSAVSTRIKILASLDISERRLPQDGAIRFDYKAGDDIVDLRVSVLPTSCGERIVMRIMDKSALNMPLADLGFPEAEFAKIQKAIHSPQGMILVTGPTGSGKSTTLYAVLNSLNDPEINLMTAEDPVEFKVEGIGQVHVKDNIGLTFTAALRSFLRQDPEVIMVGEIRDKDTGDIAVKASLTGHLVLSTLHTNDAPSTITRLINMGIPSYLITSSLTMVIAQRLARKICLSCKTEDMEATKESFLSLGFPEDVASKAKAYTGTGCDECFDAGAKGRRAIHEILVITRTIKEAILANKNDIEIGDIAKAKDGFVTMQDTGRALILEGMISIEEFKRILMIED